MINVFTTLSAVILLSGTVTADASNLPQGVHVEKTGAGQYLMAEGQRSLYWNEKEVAAGEVTCLEECLETWIPLQAPSDVQGDEQWTVHPASGQYPSVELSGQTPLRIRQGYLSKSSARGWLGAVLACRL